MFMLNETQKGNLELLKIAEKYSSNIDELMCNVKILSNYVAFGDIQKRENPFNKAPICSLADIFELVKKVEYHNECINNRPLYFSIENSHSEIIEKIKKFKLENYFEFSEKRFGSKIISIK